VRSTTQPHSGGSNLELRAAVTAVLGEDVHISAAVTAGTEAALEQVVSTGAAEQTQASSVLLAKSMLSHAEQPHPNEWVIAKY